MSWVKGKGSSADHHLVTRVLGLLLALSVAACGTSTGTDPAVSTAPGDQSDATSLATAPSTTSTTNPALDGDAVDTNIRTVPLAVLGLSVGQRIDPPGDFPSLEDLDPSAFSFPDYPTNPRARYPLPHRRARISSSIVFGEELTEQARQEDPTFSGSYEIVITYFDGFIIWDYPDLPREVTTPDGAHLYLADDGTWQELENINRPVGPIFQWSDIQDYAGFLLQSDPLVVGYETLADTPTVHLRQRSLWVTQEVWADVWLDANGAVIRLVFDSAGPGTEANQFWSVWDVQSLAPEDVGPLPPDP